MEHSKSLQSLKLLCNTYTKEDKKKYCILHEANKLWIGRYDWHTHAIENYEKHKDRFDEASKTAQFPEVVYVS